MVSLKTLYITSLLSSLLLVTGCSGAQNDPVDSNHTEQPAGQHVDTDPSNDAGNNNDPGNNTNTGDTSNSDNNTDTGANTNSGDNANTDTDTDTHSSDNASFGNITPLFPNPATDTQPLSFTNTDGNLVTRWGGRVRDRHAREFRFDSYQHFTPLYFENRTYGIEVIDTTKNGGDSLTFNLTSNYPWGVLGNNVEQPNFRAFFANAGKTLYHQNFFFNEVTPTEFTKTITYHPFKDNRKIEAGDLIEVEMGVFLRKPVEGRFNYYSRAFLYHVGKDSLEPWEGEGEYSNSKPLPQHARNGGDLTISSNYSNEFDQLLMQMGLNIAPENAQTFVEGRRLHHSDFLTGEHSEDNNPVFDEIKNLVGPHWVNSSCISCHHHNARSDFELNQPLNTFVFKTNDAKLGQQLQTQNLASIEAEATVKITGFQSQTVFMNGGETADLKTPIYEFLGIQPSTYSPRIAPALIGMGLLEAILEEDILALADPTDTNQDGISGRARKVIDATTGDTRLGRFGWQAGQPTVKQQIAGALNNDMGVTTSIFPKINCGSEQAKCRQQALLTQNELHNEQLDKMNRYSSLLGVPPRRNFNDLDVIRGEALFKQANCQGCHVQTFVTTGNHPLAELQNQTIHPYTDLLLHDMGEGLAATLGEEANSEQEWRTTPLWGMTRSGDINGENRYLHDGRAHTITEAILWHGGEAQNSQKAYRHMPASDRNALNKFLESL